MSTATNKDFQDILNWMSLIRSKVEFLGIWNDVSTIDSYIWLPPPEPAQVNECVTWLRKNIPLPTPSSLTFEVLSNARNALGIPAGEFLDFKLKGTADVMITDENCHDINAKLKKLRIVFELKKKYMIAGVAIQISIVKL